MERHRRASSCTPSTGYAAGPLNRNSSDTPSDERAAVPRTRRVESLFERGEWRRAHNRATPV